MVEMGLMGNHNGIDRVPSSRDIACHEAKSASMQGHIEDDSCAVLTENFESRFKQVWQSVIDSTDNDCLSFELSVASTDTTEAEVTAGDTATSPVVGQLNDEASDDWLSIEGSGVDDGEATNHSVHVAARAVSTATVNQITATVLLSYSVGGSVS
jgi:hypothetical protein